MRTFKLPGWDSFNDIVPYARGDDNKLAMQELQKVERKRASAKVKREKKGLSAEDEGEGVDASGNGNGGIAELIPHADVGMGGPLNRVYWPPGMEDYLRPKKREIKKKEPTRPLSVPEKKAKKAAEEAAAAAAAANIKNEDDEDADGLENGVEEESDDVNATPATKKARAALKKKDAAAKAKVAAKSLKASEKVGGAKAGSSTTTPTKSAGKAKGKGKSVKKAIKKEMSDEEEAEEDDVDDDEEEDVELDLDGESEVEDKKITAKPRVAGSRKSGRSKGRVSYAEDGDGDVQME